MVSQMVQLVPALDVSVTTSLKISIATKNHPLRCAIQISFIQLTNVPVKNYDIQKIKAVLHYQYNKLCKIYLTLQKAEPKKLGKE
jgi:hypothetical protein